MDIDNIHELLKEIGFTYDTEIFFYDANCYLSKLPNDIRKVIRKMVEEINNEEELFRYVEENNRNNDIYLLYDNKYIIRFNGFIDDYDTSFTRFDLSLMLDKNKLILSIGKVLCVKFIRFSLNERKRYYIIKEPIKILRKIPIKTIIGDIFNTIIIQRLQNKT